MAWNWLDIFVVALALLQVGLCITIGMVALRIKNGPVTRLLAAIRKNVQSGKRLADTGMDAGQKALPHLLQTRDAVQELVPLFRPVTFEDAPITYSSLARYWGMFTGVRGGIQQVQGLFDRSKTEASVVTTGRRRSAQRSTSPTMADRLGLVPPAWKRVQPYLRHVPTIRRIISTVRDQLK